MSGRRVSFRASPPGGSPGDSGVGSLSDNTSRGANPNPFKPQTTASQWNDLAALQEAYRNIYESKEDYKRKAKKLDQENIEERKLRKETEAKWRGVVNQNEQLEEDKKALLKEKRDLQKQNDGQLHEIEELRLQLAEANAQIEKLRRKAATTPPAEDPKLSRRRSKRGETAEEEKERLSKRFQVKEGDKSSDTNASGSSSSSRPSRSGRDSYIEPFGPKSSSTRPAAPPPRAAPAATAQYATYTESTHRTPTYAKTHEPTYSSVPRSAHPSVYVEEDISYITPTEDGLYHPHPLPNETVSSSRRQHHRGKGSRGWVARHITERCCTVCAQIQIHHRRVK